MHSTLVDAWNSLGGPLNMGASVVVQLLLLFLVVTGAVAAGLIFGGTKRPWLWAVPLVVGGGLGFVLSAGESAERRANLELAVSDHLTSEYGLAATHPMTVEANTISLDALDPSGDLHAVSITFWQPLTSGGDVPESVIVTIHEH